MAAIATTITRNKVFFPNILLYIVRGGNKFEETGQVTFRTRTSVGKQDLKDYLRGVYGLVVKRIATINYDGKIKRKLPGGDRYKESSYKKVIVTFDKSGNPPPPTDNVEILP